MECPYHRGTDLLAIIDTTPCKSCGQPGSKIISYNCPNPACSLVYNPDGTNQVPKGKQAGLPALGCAAWDAYLASLQG